MINNTTPGELSDKLPNLFVPAGITFSIWGVIYILLLMFIVFQARSLVNKDRDDSYYVQGIGWFFVVSNIANSAWIFAWHYELVPLSLILMVVLFLSLLTIYLRLQIGLPVPVTPLKERIFFHIPFSVYLGWITVATIANVTTVLVWAGVEPYNQTAVYLTVFVLLVALAITTLMLWRRKDIAYSLVMLWAFTGIILKRIDPRFFIDLTVASTAGIAAVVIVFMIFFRLLTRRY
jgi:hypothetical protein